MPIYIVEVTFAIPVEAASGTDARLDTIERWAKAEIRHNDLPPDATVVARKLLHPGTWANCLPWGGNGERTISEILAPPPSPAQQTPESHHE